MLPCANRARRADGANGSPPGRVGARRRPDRATVATTPMARTTRSTSLGVGSTADDGPNTSHGDARSATTTVSTAAPGSDDRGAAERHRREEPSVGAVHAETPVDPGVGSGLAGDRAFRDDQADHRDEYGERGERLYVRAGRRADPLGPRGARRHDLPVARQRFEIVGDCCRVSPGGHRDQQLMTAAPERAGRDPPRPGCHVLGDDQPSWAAGLVAGDVGRPDSLADHREGGGPPERRLGFERGQQTVGGLRQLGQWVLGHHSEAELVAHLQSGRDEPCPVGDDLVRAGHDGATLADRHLLDTVDACAVNDDQLRVRRQEAGPVVLHPEGRREAA